MGEKDPGYIPKKSKVTLTPYLVDPQTVQYFDAKTLIVNSA